jgi:hypothetical protein
VFVLVVLSSQFDAESHSIQLTARVVAVEGVGVVVVIGVHATAPVDVAVLTTGIARPAKRASSVFTFCIRNLNGTIPTS